MNPGELKQRTKRFALNVINLVNSLPKGQAADVIGRQLLRSGMSVGANYRAACRAKSSADFIHKMSIVEEEVDESAFWLELLEESELLAEQQMRELESEAKELLAITVASIITARERIIK